MRALFIAGPPGCGKTSLLARLMPSLCAQGEVAYVKVDGVATRDHERLVQGGGAGGRVAPRSNSAGERGCRGAGPLTSNGSVSGTAVVAGDVCPDHALAQALAGWVDGARQGGKAWLVVESAGLCDRCVPFVAGMPALLVLDLLESPRAPMKMRLALEAADLVVLTKAELVSPVERDLFQRFVRGVKPGVEVLVVNALTGEGLERLRARVLGLGDFERPPVLALRRPLPRGWCGVCQQGLGEA